MSHLERIAELEKTRKENYERLKAKQKIRKEVANRRMRKTVKFITSKPFVYSFLAVIQLAIMIVGLFLLSNFVNTNIFIIIMGIISYPFTIYIINSKMSNEYKLVWVCVVLALTVFGMIAYIIFGKKRISKRKMKRIRKKIDGVKAYYEEDEEILSTARETDSFLFQAAKFIKNNCDLSLSSAEDMQYFEIGEKYFHRLKEELKKAQKFIFIEYFIISNGKLFKKIFEILKEQAEKGIEIRIIYDDLGCLTSLPKNFGKMCDEANINLYCFNRLRPILDVAQNNRTHRKMVIIDGIVAFTGGVNLADEYANIIEVYGHWKDTGMMIKGRATRNFTLMFLLSWAAKFGKEDIKKYLVDNQYENNIFCLPFCDTPGSDRTICEQIYIKMIYQAKDYIYINTPYLIISDKMKEALICAVESGVDVRITVPHIPDKRIVFGLTQAFYTPLVAAGVKIYQYRPGFIHAKSIIVDDKYGVIGTSNMDFRSFYLHHECNVFFYQGVVKDMRLDYEMTCNQGILITKEQAINIPLRSRIWRGILRLIAPLM